MADLKSLLGDKYKEGMSIEELMSLDVDMPKPDMTGFISKDHFDKVASEAADYKKQLRAKMSEAEAKEKDDPEREFLRSNVRLAQGCPQNRQPCPQ